MAPTQAPSAAPTPVPPTPMPTPAPTLAVGTLGVVVHSTLSGFTLVTFTPGVQFAYRLALAALYSQDVVDVVLSNVHAAAADAAAAGRRRLASEGAVEFDVQIAAATDAAAALIVTAVALVPPADVLVELANQVGVVRSGGKFADVASAGFALPAALALVTETAAAAEVTAAPTPAPTSGVYDFVKDLDAAGLLELAWRVDKNGAEPRSVTVRLTCARSSWLSFGLNSHSGMVGTYAVIASQSGAPGSWDVREYDISSKSGSGIVAQAAASQGLRDVSVVQAGGKTVLHFTRDASSAGDKPFSLDAGAAAGATGAAAAGDTVVWAFGNDADNALGYHGSSSSGTAGATNVQWGSGASEQAALTGLTYDAVFFHGAAMLLAWGLCVPSGVIVARYYKHLGSFWYKTHRTVQSLGVLLTVVAFGIIANAVTAAQGEHFQGTHKQLGLVVTALAVLQPLNAFVRPHATEAGEEKTVLRAVWEVAHKGVGWLCLAAGVVNIFTGLELDIMKHGELAKARHALLSLAVAFAVQASAVAALSAHLTAKRKVFVQHSAGQPAPTPKPTFESLNPMGQQSNSGLKAVEDQLASLTAQVTKLTAAIAQESV